MPKNKKMDVKGTKVTLYTDDQMYFISLTELLDIVI
jgi:hypothetical protein